MQLGHGIRARYVIKQLCCIAHLVNWLPNKNYWPAICDLLFKINQQIHTQLLAQTF